MTGLRDLSLQLRQYGIDRAFYDRVRAAKLQYERVERFVIPSFSGRGFHLRRGQTFRVIQEEGPQVGDVAFYYAHNPKESFSSLRTWEIEGFFIKPYSRIWSEMPYLRPMATCVDETIEANMPKDGWHQHIVASHCSAEQYEMGSGRAGLNACRLNLLQAIEPFGLTEVDIHDNIDVHQGWYIDPNDGMFYGSQSQGRPGDYIEFYAEIDLLVAVSVCPNGDNTRPWSLPEDPPTRPLGIEIYDTGIPPKEFPVRSDWLACQDESRERLVRKGAV